MEIHGLSYPGHLQCHTYISSFIFPFLTLSWLNMPVQEDDNPRNIFPPVIYFLFTLHTHHSPLPSSTPSATLSTPLFHCTFLSQRLEYPCEYHSTVGYPVTRDFAIPFNLRPNLAVQIGKRGSSEREQRPSQSLLHYVGKPHEDQVAHLQKMCRWSRSRCYMVPCPHLFVYFYSPTVPQGSLSSAWCWASDLCICLHPLMDESSQETVMQGSCLQCSRVSLTVSGWLS